MLPVILTAIAVGGATAFGALLGVCVRVKTSASEGRLMAFAAGIMLCAACLGLIGSALEAAAGPALWLWVCAIFLGGAFMAMLNKAVSRSRPRDPRKNAVMLFVSAIAIHNLPEGIAAGVGFGMGSLQQALMLALGIALQNIPEGMVIISPMVCVGYSRWQALLVGVFTGMIEVIGTLVGYYMIQAASGWLDFLLCFAGGTMLYIICEEMIPQTKADRKGHPILWLMGGFCVMALLSRLL